MKQTLTRRVRFALQGAFMLLAVSASTVVLTTTLVLFSLFKWLAPEGRARHAITHWLSSLGETWVSVNKTLSSLYSGMDWDIQRPADLDRGGRYLVFCNHQSWVDILVLQHCLNRRAPFLRFMLKQQLIWVPFLGIAWWALDMPFLRRYSRQELLRNPELRGRDLANAARACEKLKHVPVSMMAFPEGTRFTQAKQRQQNSPYRHLLRPRYGGVGQVLYSFDDALDALLDVTIVYPDGVPTTWQFMSGQVKNIAVHIQMRPIASGIRGRDFREDAGARAQMKRWLNDIWAEKDSRIGQMLESGLN